MVNTFFGRKANETQLRDLIEVDMAAVGAGLGMWVEAFVVPEISRIQNKHTETARNDYPHLKGVCGSQMSAGMRMN